jgi:hypothetical protein
MTWVQDRLMSVGPGTHLRVLHASLKWLALSREGAKGVSNTSFAPLRLCERFGSMLARRGVIELVAVAVADHDHDHDHVNEHGPWSLTLTLTLSLTLT